MTVDSIAPFLDVEPDPLIKAGRYQVVPDGAKKLEPKAHTRITNYAKKLEDEYGLTMWKLRSVLVGVAQRSDIAVAALANTDDTRKLDDLVESAMDAARANMKRETGTALHRICERIDAGEELELPEPWKSDVASYRQVLADLHATIELVEAVVVLPRLKLAGRLDRTVIIDGNRYICDLKTGADLSHSWGSIAMQLALYAGADTIYDPDTKKHSPMPACDQEQALVIHLPAGEGNAKPYWVNIAAGRHGIAIVRSLLEWRKGAKTLATTERTVPAPRPERREYAEARVRFIIEAGHAADLAAAWPPGLPTLKASDAHSQDALDQIVATCEAVEGRLRMPFPDLVDPARAELF